MSFYSVLKPLEIKNVEEDFVAIRQPVFDNGDYSMNISQDVALNSAIMCRKST